MFLGVLFLLEHRPSFPFGKSSLSESWYLLQPYVDIQTQFHSWSGLDPAGFILNILAGICEELEGGSRNKNLGVVRKLKEKKKKDRLHLPQKPFQLKAKNKFFDGSHHNP